MQSIERAFALLETLARHDRPLGVTELADEGGLSISTIHRLLRTLVHLGYVRQNPSRNYALGSGFITLGERAKADLASWSRPLLERLVRDLDESVNLAVLQEDEVVYIAHVASSQSMRTFTEVGSRVAVHSTGVGKVMLAQMRPEHVRALLVRTGMPASTPGTLTGPDILIRELRDIAAQGFAMDEEEQAVGVRCVAVPVIGTSPPLAVSISGPSWLVVEELVRRAIPLLQDVAVSIANETRSRGSR